MRTKVLASLALAAAVFGLVFASFATHDFANHLDRQVHGIHCSFVPGLSEAETGSDCQVTLMSPYSSVFRSSYWGGIPISLPAMAVFAFLVFWGVYLLSTGAHDDQKSAGFGALAWGLPLLATLMMAYVAFAELDAACKLCIGIYVSSLVGFGASLAQYFRAGEDVVFLRPGPADATVNEADATVPGTMTYRDRPRPAPRSVWWAFPLGVLFVLVPTGAYVAAMPSYDAYAEGCGELAAPGDRYGVFVPLGGSVGGRTAIEVLDPLCPSCRGFEERLEASGLDERLYRKALLFPLDDSCNWMVSAAVHPGACEVSEAMLCVPDMAEEILAWAFENQEAIIAAERAEEGAAARMVTRQFPRTSGCVGSARAVAKLHRGLRWAVANELPVSTPQLFVDGRKLCNEDTDLGLEYSLTRMLESTSGGAR